MKNEEYVTKSTKSGANRWYFRLQSYMRNSLITLNYKTGSSFKINQKNITHSKKCSYDRRRKGTQTEMEGCEVHRDLLKLKSGNRKYSQLTVEGLGRSWLYIGCKVKYETKSSSSTALHSVNRSSQCSTMSVAIHREVSLSPNN